MAQEKEVAGAVPGADAAASDVGASDRWLLVAFVLALLAALAVAAILFQPKPPEPICAKTEARCGDHQDPAAQ